MPLNFHPDPGTIITCNFEGLIKPEMIKCRPVVTISPRKRKGDGLCIIVPLSTTAPSEIMPWHWLLKLDEPLSPAWPEMEIWVKCDMVYTFRLERLDRFHKRISDKRIHYTKQVKPLDLNGIRNCIGKYIGILR